MEEVKGVGEVGHIVGDRGTGRTWTTRQWSAGVIAYGWMAGGRGVVVDTGLMRRSREGTKGL